MTLDIFSIFSSNELSDIFALLFSDLAMSERRVQRQESRVFARQSTRQDGRHKKGTAVCDISLLFIVQPMHYCRICRLVRGKGASAGKSRAQAREDRERAQARAREPLTGEPYELLNDPYGRKSIDI